jgi:hypothetical protein
MATENRIGNGKEFFPLADLAHLNSVVAVHESPRVSQKYKFYSTLQVVEALAAEGWLPVLAREQLTRTIGGQGYQKHCIRLRQVNAPPASLDDILAEIVLTNAHNGLSKYNLFAALMRLACWNGLIVSQAVFGAISFKHIGFQVNDVIAASKAITEGLPQIASRVREYQQIALNSAEQYDFATKALALRFDSPAIEDRGLIKVKDRSFSTMELLNPVREDDAAPSLWNTFNIIQEKVTKGARFERTTRYAGSYVDSNGDVNQRLITRNKVKGIQAINTDIKFNRSLWALMENERVRRAQALVPVNA